MNDEVKTALITNAADGVKEESLLGTADSNAEAGDKSILDQAGEEAKTAQATEEKRLLEAKDTDLSEEDRTKKTELVKAQADAKVKADADAKAKAAPDKYDIKVPEGMVLDQVALDKATPIFKELGLTNEQAQKVANLYVQQIKSVQDGLAADFAKLNEDYKKETITTLGTHYKEELAYAAKCRDKFLSPETVELLNAAGLANAYPVIKDLISIGKMISEDKLVEGKTAAGEKTPAEKMFSSTNN